MNATMLSILEKRKEDLRAAKALEEKKQRIEKSRQDIGHAVDIRERIRWIRRTSYTDSTDEVDSLDDIHWWPGIIYKDHGELMLDINKSEWFQRVIFGSCVYISCPFFFELLYKIKLEIVRNFFLRVSLLVSEYCIIIKIK